MKKMIILSAGALLLVGISIGATYFILGDKSADDASQDGETAEAEATKPAKPVKPAKPAKPAKKEKSVLEPPIYFELDPDFMVAFRDPKTARFIKASVQVMTRSEDIIEAMDLHSPVIRDAVIMILSAQDSEHLATREGMEALRAGILKEVQRILTEQTGKPGAEAVYFSNFVMQ